MSDFNSTNISRSTSSAQPTNRQDFARIFHAFKKLKYKMMTGVSAYTEVPLQQPSDKFFYNIIIYIYICIYNTC